MSKVKFTIQVSSQQKHFSLKRRVNNVDGTISGGTKIESNKGSKVYNRKKFNKKNLED